MVEVSLPAIVPAALQIPYGLAASAGGLVPPLDTEPIRKLPVSMLSVMNFTDPSTISASQPPMGRLAAVKIPPGVAGAAFRAQVGALGGNTVVNPHQNGEP